MKAVARLAAVVGDPTEAQRLIRESLAIGNLETRGRRQLINERPQNLGSDGKMELVNISSLESGALDEEESIPKSFWRDTSADEMARWDLLSGVVWSDGVDGTMVIYEELKIRETSLNILIKANRQRDALVSL